MNWTGTGDPVGEAGDGAEVQPGLSACCRVEHIPDLSGWRKGCPSTPVFAWVKPVCPLAWSGADLQGLALNRSGVSGDSISCGEDGVVARQSANYPPRRSRRDRADARRHRLHRLSRYSASDLTSTFHCYYNTSVWCSGNYEEGQGSFQACIGVSPFDVCYSNWNPVLTMWEEQRGAW